MGKRKYALPTAPGPDDDDFWPWLAGFMDGEGSVGWTTAGRYSCPYITISQHERSRDVLEEIVARCGGFIHRVNGNGGFGPRHGYQLNARISAQGSVRRVLNNTLPFLRIKKQRALDVLTMMDESFRNDPRHFRAWTEIEDAYVKRHAYIKSHAEIGERLRRTEQAVQRRAWILWKGSTRPVRICPLCGNTVEGNRLRLFCCNEHTKKWETLRMSHHLTEEQLDRYAEARAQRTIAV